MAYPEHVKLKAIQAKSQACGEFLEWLDERGIELGCWAEGRFDPYSYRKTSLLAEFFGIDERKIEEEKRAMLDEMRRMNDATSR